MARRKNNVEEGGRMRWKSRRRRKENMEGQYEGGRIAGERIVAERINGRSKKEEDECGSIVELRKNNVDNFQRENNNL